MANGKENKDMTAQKKTLLNEFENLLMQEVIQFQDTAYSLKMWKINNLIKLLLLENLDRLHGQIANNKCFAFLFP